MLVAAPLGNGDKDSFSLQIGGMAMAVQWQEYTIIEFLDEILKEAELPETITLAEITQTNETYGYYFDSASIYEGYTQEQVNSMQFLNAKETAMASPYRLDWLQVNNIGFVEGNLQVRYHYTGDYRKFYAEYASIRDAEGNMLQPVFSVNVEPTDRIDIYDIHTLEELNDLSLAVQYRDALFVDGPWKLDFTFDSVFQSVEFSHVMDNHAFIKQMDIVVSPIGTQLYLQCVEGVPEEIWETVLDYLNRPAFLLLSTGEKVPLIGQISGFDHDTFIGDAQYIGIYFEMDQLEAFVIGEDIYTLKE